MAEQEAFSFARPPVVPVALERRCTLSPCGLYRYDLWRRWDAGEALFFIALNPSNADGERDDPSTRKMMFFARREGYGALVLGNLHGWRATKPAAMKAARRAGRDVVGPRCDEILRRHATSARRAVVAWGNSVPTAARAQVVLRLLLDAGCEPWCLGTNDDGTPKHPLFLANDTQLVPFAGVGR